MYWECSSSLFLSLYFFFLWFVRNATVDFHCRFLSSKFVFLSLDGTQAWWLLSLFYVSSVALYLYILRKEKRPKTLSQGTDWQALLLLSAIFKQHGRTALLDSGRLKWSCLTISHFLTSPFFFSSLLLSKSGEWLQLYDLLPICTCKVAWYVFTLLLLLSLFVM